jgi:signal transduction histidine kinase/uncharacterized protein YhfF
MAEAATSRDDLLRTVAAGTAGVVGDQFLHRLVRAVGEAFGAGVCWVSAFTDRQSAARAMACWPPHALPEGAEYPLEDTPCLLLHQRAVVSIASGAAEAFPHDDFLIDHGLDGYLAIMCPGSDGRPVGYLAVTTREELEPAKEEIEALQIFAARVGAELERREQESRLRERETEIVASRARVVAAADDERRRIGRNLHDGAQQRLVALSQFLGVAGRKLQAGDVEAAQRLIELAREQVDGAGAELRDLARGLHPVALERGLAVALDTLAMQSSLPLEVAELPDRRLPDVVQATIYYVVAEALSNAAKHAKATRVRVAVSLEAGLVRATVDDDGIGGADPQEGSGLIGLDGRLELLGGTLELDSPPGGGTTLSLRIPVTPWRTPAEPFLEFGHGDDGGQGARRIERLLEGRMRAAVSLAREWDLEGGLPRPGTLLAVRDHHGARHATVRVTRVTVLAFSEVDEEMASAAMGEPMTVADWRADRRRFFDRVREEVAVLLGERDWKLTDDEPMACLWFVLVDEPG